MRHYYNDNDPFAVAWLRMLMQEGVIPEGDIDERSILDVAPADLVRYDRCHFFAGIGGWAEALLFAGFDGPCWTGSPPCQPFSVAGAGLGRDDPRHLAPHFARLVGACRPPVLFGEQVSNSRVFGRIAGKVKRGSGAPPEWAWWDDFSDHLEAAHYAVGSGDIPAASVGAPQIRQRAFFSAVDTLGNANNPRPQRRSVLPERPDKQPSWEGSLGGWTDPLFGFWKGADWIGCRDGKFRPIEPGIEPLADGIPGRVGALRGYGNAIVPQAAAEFVETFCEAWSMI